MDFKEDCVEKYCFFWVAVGVKHAPFVFDDLHQAIKIMQKAKPAKVAYCGCGFGECKRLTKDPEHTDWFEPCEPEIWKDGLEIKDFTQPNDVPYDQ
jgi:hypothetical protein